MARRKEREYAFLTTDSFRVEVKARNAGQAYGRALKEHARLTKEREEKFGLPAGKLTRNYETYGRSGINFAGFNKYYTGSKKKMRSVS